MKAFGFLSFGHYGTGRRPGEPDARRMLHDALEMSVAADELGVNGAYFRVHHFVRQAAAPMPLLAAIAARTQHIEVGTGVIDMRYENPLYLAEEAAALDLLANGRVALGISRGAPEAADRGWEAFGYTGSTDPRGADLARAKFATFLAAIKGETMTRANAQPYMSDAPPHSPLHIEPLSPTLPQNIWWGAGSRETAAWAAEQGLNLMSSTLIGEATGQSLGDLQAEQIMVFREAFKAAGHQYIPRVSVSRSIFPIVSEQDRRMFQFQGGGSDQIGELDGQRITFGRTYAAEPDQLIEQLKADAAVMSADTLMLTIPSQLGVEFNVNLLESFATHVAPALGWKPNSEGPVQGEPLKGNRI